MNNPDTQFQEANRKDSSIVMYGFVGARKVVKIVAVEPDGFRVHKYYAVYVKEHVKGAGWQFIKKPHLDNDTIEGAISKYLSCRLKSN